MPPPPPPQGRGRPKCSSDRRRLERVDQHDCPTLASRPASLTGLHQATPEPHTPRAALLEHGRYPTRRTWERRLQAIPSTWPAPSGCGGRHLGARLPPWATWGSSGGQRRSAPRATGWALVPQGSGARPRPSHGQRDRSPWAHVRLGTVGATDGSGPWSRREPRGGFPSRLNAPPPIKLLPQSPPTLRRRTPAGGPFRPGPDRGSRSRPTPTLRRQQERPLVTPQRGRYPHTDDGVGCAAAFTSGARGPSRTSPSRAKALLAPMAQCRPRA